MKWDIYKSNIKKALDIFEFDPQILEILKDSVKNNQKIFVAGNGGSACIANHLVCDFLKSANRNWETNFDRFNAISLCNNIGYITAVSNDKSYEEIFMQQLTSLASKNDILILISSSGNSANIIKAAEYGKKIGMIVIGISGFDGGKLKQISDYSAHLNYDSYGVCEDVHSIFSHFLTCYLHDIKQS